MARPKASDCALLLIDLQVDSVAATSTRAEGSVAAAVGALIDLAELHGMPWIATIGERPGPDGLPLPEIRERLGERRPIPRSRADAFDAPALAEAVAQTGRSTLILAGVALDIGVTNAALSALERGYEVYVLAEAVATTDTLAEETANARLDRGGAVRIGFAALAFTLMDDFAGPLAGRTRTMIARLQPRHESALGASDRSGDLGSRSPSRI